jgi:DNA modification methylase
MHQPALFRDQIPKEKLPTNLTTGKHIVHRWFNIVAGFSPEFVTQCIRDAKLKEKDVVIEPFAGLGTTLVQANLDNVHSIGFEAHPFFYDLTKAKLFPPNSTSEVDEISNMILLLKPYSGALTNIWNENALKFLVKLIPENNLRLLGTALLEETNLAVDVVPLFRLIISKTLEATSGAQTDGIYKAPTSLKTSIPFELALVRTCNEIRTDILALNNTYKPKATLYYGTSENMDKVEDASCSLCVTSPPYLNNFDFAEMTRMELYFWRYATSWGEISERVRRNLIINTTTVPSDLKRNQEKFFNTLSDNLQMVLTPIVEQLKIERKLRAGKKEYDMLVYPYFSQMQSVIGELRRVLKEGSSLHLVVADAALYGVHIRTEKFLEEIMRENGFKCIEIERLRNRGHRWVLAKRQGAGMPLGEFHIHAR